MQGAYLGIDESNHGRFPEIFVAVYSIIPEDIAINGLLGKKKRKSNIDIHEILDGRDFRFVMIPEETSILLGAHDNLKVAVFSEFTKYFRDVTHVIIDGELKDSLISKIRINSSPNNTANIEAVAEADTKYKVVNMADQIARILHRYYGSFKGRRDGVRYVEYLLAPNFCDYIPLNLSLPRLSPDLERRVRHMPMHRH